MESLHEFVGHAVEWNAYMPRTEPTVGVRVASKKDARNTCSTVSHAICERTGASSVKTKHASLPIWYAESDDGTVSIHRDLCGTSLHQRGYREDIGSHRAALRSTCAYRCLFISGWSERWMDHVLIDPMCGAGTMLLEAAQTRMDMAPGLLRKEWPFQRWPDYDARVWEECVSEAEEAKRTGQERWHRDGTPPILGADVHPGAVALARDAIRQAGLEDWISVQQSDCKDWDLNERIEASTKRLVMTNPPWGMRLGTEEVNRAGGRSHRGQGMEQAMAEESWMSLRLFLKSNCSKSDAYVLCGNPDMSKHLRMRAEKKYPIWAGGVDSRLLHYCVY